MKVRTALITKDMKPLLTYTLEPLVIPGSTPYLPQIRGCNLTYLELWKAQTS